MHARAAAAAGLCARPGVERRRGVACLARAAAAERGYARIVDASSRRIACRMCTTLALRLCVHQRIYY